jgi:1-acyl-sn-glycerol-3-phosphate acyltransferase
VTLYPIGKVVCAGFITAAFGGIRVSGAEHVPLDGGCIIAANHISNFDPPILGVAAPRPVSYMAKKELFAIPVLGYLIARVQAFPVDRQAGGTAALRASLRMLKEGRCVGLFPEGGRNVEGDKEAKGGVAFLAASSGVPVVPAHIIGSDRLRPFHPVRVVFGEPFRVVRDRQAEGDDLEKWSLEIMRRIYALEGDNR